MSELWPKNLVKIHFSAVWQFLTSFLAINPPFFYILWNGFLLDHQWFKTLFLCITQLYLKKLFLTFSCDLLGHGAGRKWCFLKNSNEFSLFIYWSNFRSAEIGQTLILVKKALLEQTLTLRYEIQLPLQFQRKCIQFTSENIT